MRALSSLKNLSRNAAILQTATKRKRLMCESTSSFKKKSTNPKKLTHQNQSVSFSFQPKAKLPSRVSALQAKRERTQSGVQSPKKKRPIQWRNPPQTRQRRKPICTDEQANFQSATCNYVSEISTGAGRWTPRAAPPRHFFLSLAPRAKDKWYQCSSICCAITRAARPLTARRRRRRDATFSNLLRQRLPRNSGGARFHAFAIAGL